MLQKTFWNDASSERAADIELGNTDGAYIFQSLLSLMSAKIN